MLRRREGVPQITDVPASHGKGRGQRAERVPAPQGSSATGQILAQQAAIAELSQRALGERQLDVLLNDVCSVVARILETELVDVLELTPGRRSLRIVAGVGWRPGVVGEMEVPADDRSMSGMTLQRGGPVITEDLRTERRFRVLPVLAEHGALSGMSVRIGDMARPFGVLAAFTRRLGRFTPDDAHFLEAVAGILASAIARVRAEDELRRGRDEVAAILAAVSEGITVETPDGRLLYANDAAARVSGYTSGEEMASSSLAEVVGRFETFDEAGQSLSIDQLPGRIALETGRPSRPTLIRFRSRDGGAERWSLVEASPILAADGSVRRVVNVFREVTADKRTEQAQAVLGAALAALSGTLNVAEAARRLAEACVPRLADYASVDLLEADGSVGPAAIVHGDRARAELARRVRLLRPLSLDEPSGPGRVMREGVSEMSDLSEEQLRQLARSDEERELLLALGVRSYICVPLTARGRALGALTLVMADSGRHFDAADLQLAEELGARAGAVMDNARLFEAA